MTNSFSLSANGEMRRMSLRPFPFELAMSGFIMDNPGLLFLTDSLGTPLIRNWELPISQKSRADLSVQYVSGENSVSAVVELKNVKATQQHLAQLQDYLNQAEASTIGVLVAPDFEESVLAAVRKSKNLYAIRLNRYQREREMMVFTDVVLPNCVSRDLTKYTLLNLQGDYVTNLGKGTLALEIVRSYAEAHAELTFEQLQELFPDSLSGCGKKLHLISNEGKAMLDKKNYFVDTVIPCASGMDSFVVCRQFGIGNINPIIDLARQLGMRISEI